jgi:hypothetical protein
MHNFATHFPRVQLWYPRSRVRTRPKPSDFSGEKIHSMPSFGGEVKPPVQCRRSAACSRTLRFTWKSGSQAKLTGHFSPVIPSFADRGSLMSHDMERLWRWRAELNDGAQRACSYRPRCNGMVAPWPRPQSTSIFSVYKLYCIWKYTVITTGARIVTTDASCWRLFFFCLCKELLLI